MCGVEVLWLRVDLGWTRTNGEKAWVRKAGGGSDLVTYKGPG